MGHSELPPSSADKWFNCFAWRRLVHGLEDKSSAAAEEGTIAHEWLADHLEGKRDLVNCQDPEMSDHLMLAVDWVKLTEDKGHQIFVEERVDFGAPFGFEDLTGTSDLVFVSPDHIGIADLKYGKVVVEVQDNKQMLCYLVGAVHKFGRRPEYTMSIIQPRAWHIDGPVRDARISNEELEDFESKLAVAIAGSYDTKSTATAGPWCRHYCKALGRCETAAKKSLDLFRSEPA